MTTPLIRSLCRILIVGVALLPYPAGAGLIGTDRVAAAQAQRATVADFIGRPVVAAKLQALGVSPDEARARAAALSDADAASLAVRIDSLPAGADPTTMGILLVLALVIWRLYVDAQEKEAAAAKATAKPKPAPKPAAQ